MVKHVLKEMGGKIKINEIKVFLIICKYSTKDNNTLPFKSFEEDLLDVKIKKVIFLLNEKLKLNSNIFY